MINDSMTQNMDENELYITVQEVYIKPKIEDHGKEVNCEAALFDGDQKPLFNTSAATPMKMNVTFPPQPSSNQSFDGDKGTNLNISFIFQSNPMPMNVKWIISIPSIIDSENYTDLRNN